MRVLAIARVGTSEECFQVNDKWRETTENNKGSDIDRFELAAEILKNDAAIFYDDWRGQNDMANFIIQNVPPAQIYNIADIHGLYLEEGDDRSKLHCVSMGGTTADDKQKFIVIYRKIERYEKKFYDPLTGKDVS